jgi:hydroxyquinol 1,2-dioxygenase
VQYLHTFGRQVKLTEDEWARGIQFLTDVGHQTDAKRQEFILLSDPLGLSMLTMAMNNDKPAGCIEVTVFGPHHVEDAPRNRGSDDIANGASGEPCEASGRVLGRGGEPVADASMRRCVGRVWQADAQGNYDVQYERLGRHQARGILRFGADGGFHFRSGVAESFRSRTTARSGRCCAPAATIPGGPHICIT